MDFFGCGLRLQAHERKKLIRDHILLAMEQDMIRENERVDVIQAQMDALQVMLESA